MAAPVEPTTPIAPVPTYHPGFWHLAVEIKTNTSGVLPTPSSEVEDPTASQKWVKNVTTSSSMPRNRLYLVRKLSPKVFCCKFIGRSRHSELFVNKRIKIGYHRDIGELERVPSEIRFSTLDDPLTLQYLPAELPYFPRLWGYTLHNHGFVQGKRNVPKDLIFSLYFEYLNGGNLESFMERWASKSKDEGRSTHIPETLVWLVMEQIGSSIVKLQTGNPRMESEKEREWKPMVHGRITLSNVYLEFDEEALTKYLDDPESESPSHQCFPRIVLNNFDKARSIEPEPDANIPDPYENHVEDGNPLPHGWWDIHYLGVLLRRMVLYGDPDLPNPPQESSDEERESTKKPKKDPSQFRDYLGGDLERAHLHNRVSRYAPTPIESSSFNTEESGSSSSSPNHSKEQGGEPQPFSWELISLLLEWEDNLTADPPSAFWRRDARDKIPKLRDLITFIIPTARRHLARYRNMCLDEINQDTHGNGDLSWVAPSAEDSRVMVYRPMRRKEDVEESDGLDYEAKNQMNEDMRGFPGEWTDVEVRYEGGKILVDGEPLEQNEEDFLPWKVRRAEGGGFVSDERVPVKGGEEQEGEGEGERETGGEQTFEAALEEDEERERKRRREKVRSSRGDVLLEAMNAVMFQGCEPWWRRAAGEREKGFWNRW